MKTNVTKSEASEIMAVLKVAQKEGVNSDAENFDDMSAADLVSLGLNSELADFTIVLISTIDHFEPTFFEIESQLKAAIL